MKSFGIPATLLLSATAVSAWGTAIVANNCPFDVFLKSVDIHGRSDAQQPERIQASKAWMEPLRGWPRREDGGVSIKISRDESFRHISQFEYTLDADYMPQEPRVWYDGSNVDCHGSDCPFADYGMKILTSDVHCPSPRCLPGGCSNNDFYSKWNDDGSTKACGAQQIVTMYLCNQYSWGGGWTRTVDGSIVSFDAGDQNIANRVEEIKGSVIAKTSQPVTRRSMRIAKD